MQTSQLKHPLLCHGPDHRLVYIKLTPNGTSAPTVEEAHGFSGTAGYTSTGVYTCTMAQVGNIKDVTVIECSMVPGDNNFHELKWSYNSTTRVFTLTHRTVTYANIVSAGPAVSNTGGQITLAALVRVSS